MTQRFLHIIWVGLLSCLPLPGATAPLPDPADPLMVSDGPIVEEMDSPRPAIASTPLAQEIYDHLRNSPEGEEWNPDNWSALKAFYADRAFAPFWHRVGNVTKESLELLDRLENADLEGLNPDRYLVPRLRTHFASHDPARSAWADILLTAAYIRYALDERNGRFDPKLLDAAWNIPQEPYDASAALRDLISWPSFAELLDQLPPTTDDYWRLTRALQHYRRIQDEGGWPALPEAPTLHPGDIHPQVAALRHRLVIEGDYQSDVEPPDLHRYDAMLKDAVIRFQQRHGLTPDAVVGPSSRAVLNVPVESRIAQIETNLERWRWMPHDMGERYLLVNAAGFELKLIEGGVTRLRERIIAGKTKRQTPSFSSRITSLVVNPSWTVPKRIAVEDLLPRQQRNPDFLSHKHIEVFKRVHGRLTKVDPRSIDWNAYDKHHFPFLLRQKPGRHNSLGRLKFHLPNRYSIFLHDTPSKGLFNRSNRAFSSGCIRVQYPEQLADVLLQEDSSWSPKQLRRALSGHNTQIHRLSQSISIYIGYFTSWVDDDGRINFWPDIYKRNTPILQALQQAERPNDFIAHVVPLANAPLETD